MSANSAPAVVCDHGYWLTDCALCQKRDGECDYGSCTAPAVTTVRGKYESRPACTAHADRIATTPR